MKQINRLVKISKQQNLKNVVEQLEKMAPDFLAREGNVLHQHCAMRHLKTTLSDHEVLIHCDFSENYSTKYSAEVQAIHFGVNCSQISLHTTMIYFKKRYSSILFTISFCAMSENLEHGTAAVWAHLKPIFRFVNSNLSKVSSIHFLTDGPSSQYQNKTIFYLFQHRLKEEFTELKFATWNYQEAGHGKGAPDGIGGTLKQTADRAVTQGTDIMDVAILAKVLSDKIRTIKIEVVES